ncbi:hypothetical protein GCM10010512_38480 [Streptomyces thermoviolaceus subsp. thermoviolaceus]|nr:hypothetical protein GCM10010512_38480 [Streptomyces thermoviolaceus subsp. thermoviolaceus]
MHDAHVSGSSSLMPCCGSASGDCTQEAGRTLLLVEAPADRWGFDPGADSGHSKTVWAECVV